MCTLLLGYDLIRHLQCWILCIFWHHVIENIIWDFFYNSNCISFRCFCLNMISELGRIRISACHLLIRHYNHSICLDIETIYFFKGLFWEEEKIMYWLACLVVRKSHVTICLFSCLKIVGFDLLVWFDIGCIIVYIYGNRVDN